MPPAIAAAAIPAAGALAGGIMQHRAQNRAMDVQADAQNQAYEIQRKTGLVEQSRYQDALDTQRYNQQRQEQRDRMLMALAGRYGGRNFGALLGQAGGGGMPGTINRPRG